MGKYLSRNWVCCGFIGLFTVLLWVQTTQFDFVWDDGLYITQNKSIRSLANIPQFFFSAEAQSAETPSTSYRPLRNTVYALLNALGGKATPQAWIFHLANVLWHAAAAMLLFTVADSLWRRLAGCVSIPAMTASAFIALGFAIHPANSEAVCWAKCMDDLMAGVFVLASASSLLSWNTGWRRYVAALVWFLLAVFSKDSAVPFALVGFFILLGFHKLGWWRSAMLTVPFFLVAFFYVAVQRLVMGHLSQCPPLSGSYGQTLIDMFPVAPEYLRLLCGIPPFCADYNFMVGAPPHPLLSAGVLGGVCLVTFTGILTVWMWRRPDWRTTSFGLMWVALFLLPVSNIVPMMQYMAERFLYLPSMGFLLALGGAFLNFPRLRVAAAVTGAAIIAVWAGASLERMGIWRDNLTLFVRTEMEHPGIKRVERNAVSAVFSLPQIAAWRASGTFSEAQAEQMITTLQQARRIYPENDSLTTQVGMTYARIGRWKEAVGYLELASRQNPDSAERWYDLASVYRLAGQPAKALEANARSLRLNPKYDEARGLQTKLEHETNRAPAK